MLALRLAAGRHYNAFAAPQQNPHRSLQKSPASWPIRLPTQTRPSKPACRPSPRARPPRDTPSRRRPCARSTRRAATSSAKEALKGIDLAIPRGSIFALLGPNGAGKSTLINILAGLVIKTSGSASVWGFDIDVNPRQARASIGVVPQELNIDPFFTPTEVLEMQAGLYGVPKRERRTMEILAAMGLEDKADAYARTLSGGMRRRLLVAKAMGSPARC